MARRPWSAYGTSLVEHVSQYVFNYRMDGLEVLTEVNGTSLVRHVSQSVFNCRMDGLEVLRELHSLDMSHNLLSSINPAVLQQFHRLVFLKLAMNEIEQISEMPRLAELTVLHINDNRVRTRIGLFGSIG